MKKSLPTEVEPGRPVHIPVTGSKRPTTWHHLTQSQGSIGETLTAKSESTDLLLEILDWLKYILAAILVGLLLVIFVVQRNAVIGDSMTPTLNENDQVIVEKISKFWGGIQYGDVVTIRTRDLPQHEDGPNIIKRVIGMPGDTIELKNGGVYRNGEYLLEAYLPSDLLTESRSSEFAQVTLGLDEYYVMGDNRTVSLDSRSIGPIPIDHMIGEVLIRFYPWNELGVP
ncbi:MAG: signal peptidase I [Eubacteriales bacterium]|nr:signal peptidase I [Eubacteriales bacterium]